MMVMAMMMMIKKNILMKFVFFFFHLRVIQEIFTSRWMQVSDDQK